MNARRSIVRALVSTLLSAGAITRAVVLAHPLTTAPRKCNKRTRLLLTPPMIPTQLTAIHTSTPMPMTTHTRARLLWHPNLTPRITLKITPRVTLKITPRVTPAQRVSTRAMNGLTASTSSGTTLWVIKQSVYPRVRAVLYMPRDLL